MKGWMHLAVVLPWQLIAVHAVEMQIVRCRMPGWSMRNSY